MSLTLRVRPGHLALCGLLILTQAGPAASAAATTRQSSAVAARAVSSQRPAVRTAPVSSSTQPPPSSSVTTSMTTTATIPSPSPQASTASTSSAEASTPILPSPTRGVSDSTPPMISVATDTVTPARSPEASVSSTIVAISPVTATPPGLPTAVGAPTGTPTAPGTAPIAGVRTRASAPLVSGTGSIAINAGGGAVGSFVADTDYVGGATFATNNTIDTSGVTNPAPQAVYQTQRYGPNGTPFTYTVPGLTPGGAYRVRLHFAETYYNAPGLRVFNVSINAAPALTNFDPYAASGGMNKAVVADLPATADSGGVLTIGYTDVSGGGAESNGIEIVPDTTCPIGWRCADIGHPSPSDGQSLVNDTWTVAGGGGDIWGTSDQFHYVWQTVAGNGTASAHVTSQTVTGSSAKAGVMFRASTDPGAPFYDVVADT